MTSNLCVIYNRLSEPMTRHRVAKLCKLDGLEVKRALDELVDKGLVVKSGGGAGTKYGWVNIDCDLCMVCSELEKD